MNKQIVENLRNDQDVIDGPMKAKLPIDLKIKNSSLCGRNVLNA